MTPPATRDVPLHTVELCWKGATSSLDPLVMQLIKVAAAVLNQTPLDWDGNKAHMLGAIAEARRQGVSLLCLPEMCITGYGCEDAFQSTGVQQMAWRVLE